MKMRLLVGTIVLAIFTFLGTAFAQPKIVIKIASVAPAGTPWVTHLDKWRENLLAATNGEIEIKVFPGGQLGSEEDVIKQVMRGRISASNLSASPIAAVFPEFALMSTPFLFDDTKTIDCIYDTKLKDEFSQILAKKGLKLIQWGETGWVHIYAQDNLSDPASADGYKIRIGANPMSHTLWSSVGANGIELPYVETPAALQTGMVKGGESAVISFFAFGIVKIAPQFMLTRHMHQAGATVMNLKQWNKLSPDQQKAIMDARPSVAKYRGIIRGYAKSLVEKYKTAGGPIYELTAEQRAAWKNLVEPNWPKFIKDLGPEAEAMWPKILEAKKACQ
jgi:TRAP-type C4-dicarboxylate transport system substrate-binding protein